MSIDVTLLNDTRIGENLENVMATSGAATDNLAEFQPFVDQLVAECNSFRPDIETRIARPLRHIKLADAIVFDLAFGDSEDFWFIVDKMELHFGKAEEAQARIRAEVLKILGQR